MRSIAAVIALAAVVAACGGRQVATARAGTALSAALAGVNATRDAFVAWDADEQAAIVEKAASENVGVALLAAHREKRRAVTRLVVLSYSSLAAAATALALYESGDDAGAAALVLKLRDAAKAISDMHQALDAVRSAR